MKTFRKWLLIVLAVLLAPFLVIGLLGAYARKVAPWPTPIPGVRFEPLRPILRDVDIKPDNAFFYIRQLADTPTDIDPEEWDAFIANGWKPGTYSNLNQIYIEYSNNLALFARAATMTNCQVETIDSATNVIPWAYPFRSASRLKAYEISHFAAESNWAGVASISQQGLAMCAHVQREGGLFEHISSIRGEGFISEQMFLTMLRHDLPRETANRMQSALLDYERALDPLSDMMRHEWMDSTSLVDLVYSGEDDEIGFEFDVNAIRLGRLLGPVVCSTRKNSVRHLFDIYSRLIDAADDAAKAHALELLMDRWRAENRNHVIACSVDDPIGRTMAFIWAFRVREARWIDHEARARTRATVVALGIRQFQQDHDGAIPGRLEDLLPGYVGEIPKDPFRPASNLLYRVSGTNWVVYSVGPNENDDGGILDGRASADIQLDSDVCVFSDTLERAARKYNASRISAE